MAAEGARSGAEDGGAAARRGDRPGLAALGIAVLAFLYGILVPTYSDEIVWRLQERAGLDGRDAMFNDLCGPHTILTPPAFMMPVRWFSATVNSTFPDPLIVRFEGIFCGLLFLGLLWKLVAAAEPTAARRGTIRAVAFSLLALGVLPLLMTMSRPEQPLILATAGAILLALTGNRDASGARAWLRAAAVVVLAAIGLSYHLKGVLYAVVALACLGLCARGRATVLPRAVGAATLVILTAIAAQYWSARFACPGDPVLAKNLAGQNVAMVLAQDGGLGAALRQVAGNVLPFEYLRRTVPAPFPMSQWLPWTMFPLPVAWGFGLMMLIAWFSALYIAIKALIGHWRGTGRTALANPPFLLAITILVCVLVWSASQTIKNDYESAHVMPMLAIVVVLGLSLRPKNEPVLPKQTAGWFLLAAAFSLVGMAAFSARPLLATAVKGGYADNQLFSYSGFGFAATRADAERAMRAAGFPDDRRLRRVLIDDGTYFVLHDSFMPLHRVGVLHIWNGAIKDPADYLLSRGSDGIVMRCAYLPAALRAVAARSGEICAVADAGLRRAANR